MKKIHFHAHKNGSQSKAAMKIAIAAIACTLVLELAGAFWTNSLALLSDVTHLIGDLLSFCLSLFAIILAEKPFSDTRTFGWHRMEVFAALSNGLTVFGMAFWIFLSAFKRLVHPQEVMGFPMLVIAIIGLAANLFVIWKLHPHLSQDVNVKSAYLHALGDALASVAVVVSGLLILITKGKWIDPVTAMIVAGIIILGAYRIFRDSIQILLEGVPENLSRTHILESIEKISGGQTVKDIHIWNICSHLCALSVHLTLPENKMAQQKEILEQIGTNLEEEFNIVHSTIQIESGNWR